MTAAQYETAPCPPGAICTPRGVDHIVSYAFKVDRGGSPRRPFVVHADIGGVDLCLDVKVELEIRTRMPHQVNGPHVPAEVNLQPRIDFEPCGTYLRTNAWLGTREGLKARQEALHKLHMEIVNAFGGEAKLKSWKNLDDVPPHVTVLGASVEHVREYVNEKLSELGDAAGGGHTGHDGRAGRSRRSRTRPFTMPRVEPSRSSARKQSAKRRGPAPRAARRRRQTSKSKTPSRGR